MAEYDRKTAWQKIDMVSFHNLTVKFLEAHRRGSGGPAGGGISQNVHTPAILYPPTGRKIVVSYMHSQEPRAARPWPGAGGEICHPRACSAAGRLCILPPGCGGRQTTPRPRVLNIKREKNRPGAGTSSGPICWQVKLYGEKPRRVPSSTLRPQARFEANRRLRRLLGRDDDGIIWKLVISEDMRLRNDTSHGGWDDNFGRNRISSAMRSFSQERPSGLS